MSDASSTAFARPLRIELRASRRLALLGGVAHAAAVGACLLAHLPLPLCLLGALLVTLHWRRFLLRQCSGGASLALAALRWDAARGWRIRPGGGDWQPARLHLPVFVSAPLAVVRFRLRSGRRCAAVVVADRLPQDDFRRLRVRLLQTAAGSDR